MTKPKEPTPQKLLLTAIMKDDSEIDQAKRMLESFMPYFDGLCVALTGTSKKFTKLKKLIEHYNGEYVETSPKTHPEIYHQKKSGDWMFADFSAARNASYAHASEMQKKHSYDWWSWADTDDILIAGDQLQEIARHAKEDLDVDMVYFVYWYSVVFNEKLHCVEDVAIEHFRERLLRPDMFKWISRLHEVQVPKEEGYKPRTTAFEVDIKRNQKCVWTHLPDDEDISKNLVRNDKILEVQLEEEEWKDPRTIFHYAKITTDLAKESMMNDEPVDKYKKLFSKADKFFERYLMGEPETGNYQSGWREERGNGWEYRGNIAGYLGDYQRATIMYHRAIQDSPGHHMPYILLANAYAQLQMWDEENHWLDVVSNMPKPKPRTTIGNPLEIKVLLATARLNQSLRNNKMEEAVEWYKTLAQLKGMDLEKDKRLAQMQDLKLLNDAAVWSANLATYLNTHGETEKVRHLIDAIPAALKREKFVQDLANQVLPPKKWKKKSIVWLAIQDFEEWSDNSLARGLGGSETAIVKLSQEWAKKGYDVHVFCQCDEEGERKGVTWHQWQTFNFNDEYDTLIVWRQPGVITKDLKANNLFYDGHDIENQMNWTEEKMDAVDKVFFKSQWHRNQVPKLPDEKAVVISNGIIL